MGCKTLPPHPGGPVDGADGAAGVDAIATAVTGVIGAIGVGADWIAGGAMNRVVVVEEAVVVQLEPVAGGRVML